VTRNSPRLARRSVAPRRAPTQWLVCDEKFAAARPARRRPEAGARLRLPFVAMSRCVKEKETTHVQNNVYHVIFSKHFHVGIGIMLTGG
jgi:hypothetical protein